MQINLNRMLRRHTLVLLRTMYFDSLKKNPQKSEAFGLHQILDYLSLNQKDQYRKIKTWKFRLQKTGLTYVADILRSERIPK